MFGAPRTSLIVPMDLLGRKELRRISLMSFDNRVQIRGLNRDLGFVLGLKYDIALSSANDLGQALSYLAGGLILRAEILTRKPRFEVREDPTGVHLTFRRDEDAP